MCVCVCVCARARARAARVCVKPVLRNVSCSFNVEVCGCAGMVWEAVGVMGAVLIQGQLVSDTRCNGEEDEIEKQLDKDDMLKQVRW